MLLIVKYSQDIELWYKLIQYFAGMYQKAVLFYMNIVRVVLLKVEEVREWQDKSCFPQS